MNAHGHTKKENDSIQLPVYFCHSYLVYHRVFELLFSSIDESRLISVQLTLSRHFISSAG